MGSIPGYNVFAYRNGSVVRPKSYRVKKQRGKIGLDWELRFNEPINIGADDTWTIQRSVGGHLQTWISAAPAWTRGREDGVDPSPTNAVKISSSRNVSGNSASVDANDVLEYGCPKTLVFFNPSWLEEVAPSAAVVNNILKTKDLGGAWTRLQHDRLPGKEFQDTGFLCYPASTHHEIGRQLAMMIGYSLVVNTPDLALVDTFTVASGTTWDSAIKANFTMWEPTPVAPDTDKIIYLLDALTDDADIEPLQLIQIDYPAIVSVSDSVSKTRNLTDHLIVIGRKTKDSVGIPSEEPDYTPVTIPEVSLPVTETLTIPIQMRGLLEQLQLPDQTSNFGDPDNPVVPASLGRSEQVLKNYVVRNPVRGDKRVPLEIETRVYDQSDEMIGKHLVQHYYSAGLKPVRTVETHYTLCPFPGSTSWELRPLSYKTTLQNKYIKPLNMTLTSILTEKVILYETATKGGVTYKDDPQPMIDLLRTDFLREAIETDADTKQDTLTMPTEFKTTGIYRLHDDILIKTDITMRIIPKQVDFNSEILTNPVPGISIQVKDAVWRREYYRKATSPYFTTDPSAGSGKLVGGLRCYRNAKTINHQDICTEATGEQLAKRIFRSEDVDDKKDINIRMPIPYPWEGVDYKIRLPNWTASVNGSTVTVPGGDYVMISWEESGSFDGDGNIIESKVEQRLTVRLKP